MAVPLQVVPVGLHAGIPNSLGDCRPSCDDYARLVDDR